jgi:hypothetical protein
MAPHGGGGDDKKDNDKNDKDNDDTKKVNCKSNTNSNTNRNTNSNSNVVPDKQELDWAQIQLQQICNNMANKMITFHYNRGSYFITNIIILLT